MLSPLEPACSDFINDSSYGNQYAFSVNLLPTPTYGGSASFSSLCEEIKNNRPALLGCP